MLRPLFVRGRKTGFEDAETLVCEEEKNKFPREDGYRATATLFQQRGQRRL